MRHADVQEKSEIAHLIEKSPQSMTMMLLVGVLLSLTISGSLMNLETYAKCNSRDDVGPRSLMYWQSNDGDDWPRQVIYWQEKNEHDWPRQVMYWQANEATMDLFCLAAQNKLSTVIIIVWVPILLYCVLAHYKTRTVSVVDDEDVTDDENVENFSNLSISINEDPSTFSNLLYPEYFYNYDGFN